MTDTVIVGRVSVPRTDAKCLECAEPFKFGTNIFTKEGQAEVASSGICEKCFDDIFWSAE